MEKNLPVAAMSHIIHVKNSTQRTAHGYCMKHSVWTSEADIFHPYEKHHSTVADASKLAEELHVKNLLLYHTEDKNLLLKKRTLSK